MMDTRKVFAEHNLRCTEQRRALYEALASCTTHPTAEELYRAVHDGEGRLSLATVYNTLEVLCAAGLCRKIPTTSGCCRYDADTSEHMHVVFRESGEIRDLPPDLAQEISDLIPAEVRTRLEAHLGVPIEGVAIQLHASGSPRD